MFILSITILTIIIFLIETVAVDFFTIWRIKPDFILIIVVYSGLFLTKNSATAIGFTAGFIQDALSFKLMGINSLSKCLIGFSIGGLREKILNENLIVQYLFTFIATIFNGMIFFLALKWLLFPEIKELDFLGNLFIQAVYNSILAPPIFWLLNKMRDTGIKPLIKSGGMGQDKPLTLKIYENNKL